MISTNLLKVCALAQNPIRLIYVKLIERNDSPDI